MSDGGYLSFSARMSRVILCSALLLLTINIINGQRLLTTPKGGIGAVYTMTVGFHKNRVIVNRLYANGELKRVRFVDTNGIGVNSTNTDPLFSQGRAVVHSNYLFVINPGSNSLSMFLINPSDATKLTLISVEPVYGSYPISVAVNSKYACTLTGGQVTGIRCFTYSSTGLLIVSSFDRDLTKYVSKTVPITIPLRTMSEILFSADNRALIVAVKGDIPKLTGHLLFFLLNPDNTELATDPVQQRPKNAVFPFSMTLVGENGLLVTDPGKNLILTMKYSSKTGRIYRSQSSLINASLANAICWSTHSPRTGNYYIVSTVQSAVIELEVNLRSRSTPVKIVRYYELPPNDIALDTMVVSLPDSDYLYVIAARHDIIMGYKLVEPGKATPIGRFVQQNGYAKSLPNEISNDQIDETNKSKHSRKPHFYADPSPPHDGPLLPVPSFVTSRTRPVLTGLAVYLQHAPHGHYPRKKNWRKTAPRRGMQTVEHRRYYDNAKVRPFIRWKITVCYRGSWSCVFKRFPHT